ncbi:TraB/GumN family protein [Phenylobacterium sp.]|jgi:uncharacterized protein YbaP (TraB family)|uniref:TraB/GumN family protein n=1 Tax=Phenylobacterium sp. TaxID=1871053 RepID=UPI0037C8689C
MAVPHRTFLYSLLALFLAAPAAAQTPAGSAPAAPAPVLDDPNATLVDELVVRGRLPGPAWWRVSDGDTTVYILGAPSLAPKQMQWDRVIFERRLKGANVVILPFINIRVRALGSLGTGVALLRLRSGGPYENRLDPATRARFVAARTRLGQDARRYATTNPLAAGVQLALDYRDGNALTNSDPAKLVRLLAKQAGVRTVEKTYDLGPQLSGILKTPHALGRMCFDEVLAQAEAGPEVTRAAARAWAAGDVAGALANERTYERCLAAVTGGRSYDERTKADTAAAIEAALNTPGHALALVPLRPLLAERGVLDRLRARGFTVKAPNAD